MERYFILAVDSYIEAFSMAEAARTLKFSYDCQNGTDILRDKKPVSPGDKILVYQRSPVSSINILLEIIGTQGQTLELKKLLEVAQGAGVGEMEPAFDPEYEDIAEITEQKFQKICHVMISDIAAQSIADGTGEGDVGNAARTENQHAERVTKAGNVLLYGVPGVGKSHEIQSKYCNDWDRMERVVFHPDYTYSDFVGQILPRVEKDKLKYVFIPGPFTRMLHKAWNNPTKEFYLIIEEINRGNAPAIFGEIFQLLDRKDETDGRWQPSEYGESEYGISNYDVALAVYGNGAQEVRIPSNMWVLATMNTADQNVFTLDTAFQRRWSLRHIKNDVKAAKHAGEKIQGTEITWGAFASVINDMIVDLNVDLAGSEDKRLGAYFVKPNELAPDRFSEKALKYLWDDAFKMDREALFDKEMKSLDRVLEAYEETETDKLEAVLKPEVYQKMRGEDVRV